MAVCVSVRSESFLHLLNTNYTISFGIIKECLQLFRYKSLFLRLKLTLFYITNNLELENKLKKTR